MTARRISMIILFAKDMPRMAAFYRDVIGLRPAPSADDSEGFVTLDAGGCRLCLHEIPEPYARGIEIGDPPQARAGTPIKLTFYSADVRGDRAQLIARGVRMEEVRELGDLQLCNGIDVEGNVFQLANR
jgi:catechol 2,3-dioxygenase-like lactoylglutathione lyase family enzyme